MHPMQLVLVFSKIGKTPLLTKFQLPLQLIMINNAKQSTYASLSFWKALAHLAKPDQNPFSLKTLILLTWNFFWKSQRNLCCYPLIHHSPTFVKLLQAQEHDCRAIFHTVTSKLLPWQILNGAFAKIVELKLLVHSSPGTLMCICFNNIQSNNHQITTVLQIW